LQTVKAPTTRNVRKLKLEREGVTTHAKVVKGSEGFLAKDNVIDVTEAEIRIEEPGYSEDSQV